MSLADGQYTADDGAQVLVENGMVVAAVVANPDEPDGSGWTLVDPADYQLAGGDFADEPAAMSPHDAGMAAVAEANAAREVRAAAEAEERAAEAQRQAAYQAGQLAARYPTYDPHAEERYAAAVERDIENLGAERGHALTMSETWRFLNDHHADHEAGIEPDPYKSAANAGVHDTSTTEGKIAWMTERIEDDERRQRGATPDDPPPRRRETYDMSKPDQVADRIADGLAGYDVRTPTEEFE